GVRASERGQEARLCLVETPREHRLGNGTGDDVLPEPARRQRARHRREAAAVATDQFGKLADPRRQQRFDQLAQTPRQNRRGSTGADRDHHLTAIDDGGKNEGREFGPVDDIDGDEMAASAATALSPQPLPAPPTAITSLL